MERCWWTKALRTDPGQLGQRVSLSVHERGVRRSSEERDASPKPSDSPAFTLQGQGLGALKVTLSSLQGEVLWSGIQEDSGSLVHPGALASGVYLIQWEELHGTSSGTARWVLR